MTLLWMFTLGVSKPYSKPVIDSADLKKIYKFDHFKKNVFEKILRSTKSPLLDKPFCRQFLCSGLQTHKLAYCFAYNMI